jgi:hypothetical protein
MIYHEPWVQAVADTQMWQFQLDKPTRDLLTKVILLQNKDHGCNPLWVGKEYTSMIGEHPEGSEQHRVLTERLIMIGRLLEGQQSDIKALNEAFKLELRAVVVDDLIKSYPKMRKTHKHLREQQMLWRDLVSLYTTNPVAGTAIEGLIATWEGTAAELLTAVEDLLVKQPA